MLSRRKMIRYLGASVALGSVSIPFVQQSRAQNQKSHNFSFCLNTSTIREQKLGLVKEIQVAADAGYDGIEIWMSTLQEYLAKGGSTGEIKRIAEDLNIRIDSAISFPSWIVDDASKRKEALEQAREEMKLLAEIGCKRVAAPPAGATKSPKLNLSDAAERYRALLEIGDETGVLPQLELWGFSKNLHRFGEVLFVAAESGHPKACILPDVYHIYRGGSDFNSLKLLSGQSIQMFHMNDFPATPPRDQIKDSDRVYPGDGVAPLDNILMMLHQKQSPIVLSLELFNPTYWKQDASVVVKTGLKKMKQAVDQALS